MRARSIDEPHRVATPLELLFDLVYVVAIAQASSSLHHAFAEGHVRHGILSFAMAFFAIQWAWMNFTWFASAYDCDDVRYRLATLVQMAGALILAAGIPALFELDLRVATFGYVLMRLALVGQWLRAARADAPHARSARHYAIGITLVQIGWLALLALPPATRGVGFVVLALAEIAVPVWAERSGRTPWHPHHIAERYGLFTIIVLGESILAATVAIQSALAGGEAFRRLVPVVVGGIVLVFSMWWLYFDRPIHHLLTSRRRAFVWGYGHYFVFASAAAVGAGLALQVDWVTGHAHVGRTTVAAAVTVPVAVYLVALGLLHNRGATRTLPWLGPVVSIAVLAVSWTPVAVPATGALLAGLLAIKLRHSSVRRGRSSGSGAPTATTAG